MLQRHIHFLSFNFNLRGCVAAKQTHLRSIVSMLFQVLSELPKYINIQIYLYKLERGHTASSSSTIPSCVRGFIKMMVTIALRTDKPEILFIYEWVELTLNLDLPLLTQKGPVFPFTEVGPPKAKIGLRVALSRASPTKLTCYHRREC